MSWDQRVKTKIRNFFVNESKVAEGNAEDEDGKLKQVQYRLEATERVQQRWYQKVLTCGGLIGGGNSRQGVTSGINPNQKLALYLHWMFRVSFVVLFAVMCMVFFGLVILFAGFITLAGKIDPQCVRVGGNPFNTAGTAFADAVSHFAWARCAW